MKYITTKNSFTHPILSMERIRDDGERCRNHNVITERNEGVRYRNDLSTKNKKNLLLTFAQNKNNLSFLLPQYIYNMFRALKNKQILQHLDIIFIIFFSLLVVILYCLGFFFLKGGRFLGVNFVFIDNGNLYKFFQYIGQQKQGILFGYQ